VPEFGPHLVGVGVLKVVEYGQGPPPGILGLVLVPGGVVSVAEVAEDRGLVEAVTEVQEHAKGVVIAVVGFG